MIVNLLLKCAYGIFSFKVILPPHFRVFSSAQYGILFSESVSFLSIHLATSIYVQPLQMFQLPWASHANCSAARGVICHCGRLRSVNCTEGKPHASVL